MDTRLEKAEEVEIQRHQQDLSRRMGRVVSREEAIRDWAEHYAERWRSEYQARMLSLQREEILKHKWIESEKAQRDLGREAIMEWITKYAEQWRVWYETQPEQRS